MSTAAISVIVPTRDRPGALATCLAALDAQSAPDHEIVVVDDDSRDARAVGAAVASAPRARLVRGDGRGPAAARNRGAAIAFGSTLCFTDDDCAPDREWIAALRAHVEAGAAVVAGQTRNGSPTNPYATASQIITNSLTEASFDAGRGTVSFAPTSNLACTAAVWRDVPFDEHYPTAAGEDRDWCSRVRARGVEIRYEPSACVEHRPDLDAAAFWRQHVRYGRGAYRWQRHQAAGARLQPARFYADLVRTAFAHGPRVGGLVVLAQLATAAGIASEALDTRRARR